MQFVTAEARNWLFGALPKQVYAPSVYTRQTLNLFFKIHAPGDIPITFTQAVEWTLHSGPDQSTTGLATPIHKTYRYTSLAQNRSGELRREGRPPSTKLSTRRNGWFSLLQLTSSPTFPLLKWKEGRTLWEELVALFLTYKRLCAGRKIKVRTGCACKRLYLSHQEKRLKSFLKRKKRKKRVSGEF